MKNLISYTTSCAYKTALTPVWSNSNKQSPHHWDYEHNVRPSSSARSHLWGPDLVEVPVTPDEQTTGLFPLHQRSSSSQGRTHPLQPNSQHRLHHTSTQKIACNILTLKSFTSFLSRSISWNESKKSDRSTCLGTTQRVSISAPTIHWNK